MTQVGPLVSLEMPRGWEAQQAAALEAAAASFGSGRSDAADRVGVGCATVTYDDPACVPYAVAVMDGVALYGRQISVHAANAGYQAGADVCLRNLPHHTAELEVSRLCEAVVPLIVSTRMLGDALPVAEGAPADAEPGFHSHGICFVTCASVAAAADVIVMLHKRSLGGRQIAVDFSHRSRAHSEAEAAAGDESAHEALRRVHAVGSSLRQGLPPQVSLEHGATSGKETAVLAVLADLDGGYQQGHSRAAIPAPQSVAAPAVQQQPSHHQLLQQHLQLQQHEQQQQHQHQLLQQHLQQLQHQQHQQYQQHQWSLPQQPVQQQYLAAAQYSQAGSHYQQQLHQQPGHAAYALQPPPPPQQHQHQPPPPPSLADGWPPRLPHAAGEWY
jgi:hypothetical protein